MLRIYTFPKMGCLKYYRIHPNLTNHTKDQHKDHNSQLAIKIHEYPNAKIHTNKNKPQNLWGKKKKKRAETIPVEKWLHGTPCNHCEGYKSKEPTPLQHLRRMTQLSPSEHNPSSPLPPRRPSPLLCNFLLCIVHSSV